MAQHPVPAADEHVPPAVERSVVTAAPPRAARWSLSRGGLLAALAVLLPAMASLLAAVLTEDIAYHIATGRLMLERGALIETDPFTFSVFGEPWLHQQWAASALFAAVFDLLGWAGLLLLRAALIGTTFGLVYLACRATDVSRIMAALVTLGAFVVAATNLALRAQLFGVLCFAAVVTILAWRRRYPLALWLIPLVMIAWANTHGSFFVGWAALGVAFLADVVARRRLALATGTVALLSVAATLLNPWGVALWAYVVELARDPVIAILVSEWQAPTLGTPTGLFFYASAAFVLALLLLRGRVLPWLQLLWLGGLALLSLLAVRNVVWWAVGAAPLVALLLRDLEIRGRRLGDPAADAPRGLGYSAIVLLVLLLGLAALPLWRPSHPLYGPEGVVQHAPRGVTETLRAEADSGDRLFSAQAWASWFELALPGVPVMVDTRIELFERETWSDYLAVVGGRDDWPEILERWSVEHVALEAGAEVLPFIAAHPHWALRHEDDEGVVYSRVEAVAE